MKHAFLVTMLLVAACAPAAQEEPAAEEAEAAEPTSRVEREEVAKPASPPPPPPQAVIQTQPGPDGSQVALNKVAVTGDVMTVQLTYTSNDGGVHYVKLDQVSVIDDATAQQISILKNNAGKWLASPLSGDNEIKVNLYNSPAIVWFKFPAPPPTSPTVSINIPEVGPFDGVPVTR